MKLNAGKRILMFFHWLLSLLVCAAFAACIIAPEWTMGLYQRVMGGMASTRVMIIGIAVLAIYVLVAVVQAWIIFQRGKRADRGFITVDSSDTGRVRIAIPAIEQMVRQSVISIEGITDMRISIENMDDAIGINITATLQNGSHVPTVTVNMQRAIRQFVELNCGVAVRAVSISINAVNSANDGGRRRGRRRDEAKPAPTLAPIQEMAEPEAPAEPETPAEPEISTDPVESFVPEPEAADAAETEAEEDGKVWIPEPGPIRLHFDHLPVEPENAQDAEVPETFEES